MARLAIVLLFSLGGCASFNGDRVAVDSESVTINLEINYANCAIPGHKLDQ